MKKLTRAVALLLITGCGSAMAQPAAGNPFSRPTGATGGGNMGVAAPGIHANQGMPHSPYAGMNGIPPFPGAAPPSTAPSDEEESITVSRVGTVNGVRIYRGDNTYLFEKVSERKLIRKRAGLEPQHGSSMTPGDTPQRQPGGYPAPMPGPNKKLPTQVGKPTVSK